MVDSENKFRFENMDFGESPEEFARQVREEEIEIRVKNISKLEKRILDGEKYKRKVERKGVCEYCETSIFQLRWVMEGDCYGADGTYQCYECFYNNLDNWSGVMVPSISVRHMKGYMEEYYWEELWEQEQEERELRDEAYKRFYKKKESKKRDFRLDVNGNIMAGE